MEQEEGLQIGLAAVEEIAEIEGERPGHGEEDDQEHIGHRRGEIAGQLTLEDVGDIAHGRQLRPIVTVRKTSSRRPRSTRTSSISWAGLRAISPISEMIGCPARA